jgi:hypothetical protein
VFAEVGVAYAGFLAIFLVFARRDARFSPADSLRVRAILLGVFTVVLGSLLPVVLVSFIAEPAVWRVAGAVVLGLFTLVCLSIFLRQRRMTAEERREAGLFNNVFSWSTGTLVNVLLALSLPSPRPHAFYLAALFGILCIGTSNFITIAFHRLL